MKIELKNEIFKWGLALINILVWLILFTGFVILMQWSIPRQTTFLVFMISLVTVIMLLSQYKPNWSVFLTILVIPGITTSSLTFFNKISEGPNVGVFGPAALFPALALIFGIWLRTLYRKEKIEFNPLTKILLFFVGISAASILSVFWRYSNFWPFNNFNNPILNLKGDLFSSVYSNLIWTFVNYFTGPFLMLAICQAAWICRQKKEKQFNSRKWILIFIVLPVFIGSIAVFYVGWKQIVDVWFGANKFYVWPWINRINATFFDPNALGSFIILIVPWILASIFLLASFRRWLAFPGIIFAGFLLWRCGSLISHSGSRISILGIIIILMVTIVFGLLLILKRIKSKILFRISAAIILLLFFTGSICLFYYSPKLIKNLEKKAVFKRSSLFERVKKLPLGSFKGLYQQITKDRGAYAELAVSMIKDVPLTGVGLGCFITEQENWKKKTKTLVYVPDTACNYYLQIASEQGIIALFVILTFFGLWWKLLYKVWKTEKASGFWFFLGTGVAATMIIFIFGMHTLAHEIQCLFWIFLSQPVIAYKSDKIITENNKSKSNIYFYILFSIICIAYFCQAASYLSLDKQREKFGWKIREGFYKWENWGKLRVRQTRKEANEIIASKGIVFQQEWACLHPNITSTPVKVTFQLDNFSTNFVVSDNKWKTLDINLPFKYFDKSIKYKINVNRTWSGKKFNINDDKRKFGVALKESAWLKNKGLYSLETWPEDGCPANGKKYNWTEKQSKFLINSKNPYCNFLIMAAHPDVTQRPVVVTLKFNTNIIDKILLTNSFWYNKTYFIQPFLKKGLLSINVDVNRSWCPTNFGFIDSRELGLAIAKPELISDIGFYHQEIWKNKFQYRWTKKQARWAQNSDVNGKLVVDYLISNPDIKEKPIIWTLFINEEKVCSQNITNAGWHSFSIEKPPESWFDLKAEIDRTWNPIKFGNKDDRDLGFAIKINK